MNSEPKEKRNLHIAKSLRHQTPLEGGTKRLRKNIYIYPANKPELKKLLNCRSLSSSNLQVTISRVGVSVFKGRPKGKLRPT